ncbi:MAG: hypothetical protein WBV22_01245 [Anaerolineaceae bacterium]
MATEEVKKQNVLRLTSMALASLAAGVWDTLGETSFALTNSMGEEILKMFEKEMGLEIAGETPENVIKEIGRIFVDEFGFAKEISIAGSSADKIELRVRNCINVPFTDRLAAAGVEKPFICPIMNATAAALSRMGFKMRNDVTKWPDGKGSIITFTKI